MGVYPSMKSIWPHASLLHAVKSLGGQTCRDACLKKGLVSFMCLSIMHYIFESIFSVVIGILTSIFPNNNLLSLWGTSLNYHNFIVIFRGGGVYSVTFQIEMVLQTTSFGSIVKAIKVKECNL